MDKKIYEKLQRVCDKIQSVIPRKIVGTGPPDHFDNGYNTAIDETRKNLQRVLKEIKDEDD